MTDGENPLVAAAQAIGKPKEETDRPTEPQEGSFERFMLTFGAGATHKWGA